MEADIILWFIPHFDLETGLSISFKLSPEGTAGMKCKTLETQEKHFKVSSKENEYKGSDSLSLTDLQLCIQKTSAVVSMWQDAKS